MDFSPTLQIDPHELKVWFEFGQQSYKALQFCESIVLNNPHIFDEPHKRELTRQQARDLCNEQLAFFSREMVKKYPNGEFMLDYRAFFAAGLILFQYDHSLCIKYCINFMLFLKNFLVLGNLPIHKQIFERCIRLEEWGAFLMTQVGHGSNVQGVMTTATYDIPTQTFIINTPSDMAAKIWIGNLAKTATLGVVVAQLICQGKNQGVHLFIVPLRDRETHEVYPGIVIGDCGPKIGNQGIDNGICWFKNYRIPREYLLNKVSQVAPDGTFTSTQKSKNKRFGLQMSPLSSGRVGLSLGASQLMTDAVGTALRYGSVRQQFNNSSKTREMFLLEYPLHQYRLIPLFAEAIAYKMVMKWMIREFGTLTPEDFLNTKKVKCQQTHAISACLKPLIKWRTMAALQESREACGGHGYSQFSRFGNWKDDYDVNLTWEGDNNVLIQQTIRWLLSNYQKGRFSQYETLKELEDDMKEAFDPKDVRGALKWKVQYMLQESVAALSKEGIDSWNDLQAICLQKLGLSMAEFFTAKRLHEEMDLLKASGNKEVISLILEIYCTHRVLQDIGEFYRGGFITPEQHTDLKLRLRELNAKLLPNLMDLVNAVMYHDRVVNTSLGHSDRDNLYQRFLNEVRGAKDFISKTKKWRNLFPRPMAPRPRL